MQLCSRCNAAVDHGRSHCPICDLPLGAPADPTTVAGGPPFPSGPSAPPAYGAAPPPPPGYPSGPAPGYPPVSAYGYPPVPAYGYPAMPVAAPPKSKAVAALLCFFLGGLGIHRFYTGQVGLGLALLLTTLFLGWTLVWLVVTFVWVMVDLVLILSGGVNDQWGRPLV